MQSVELLFLNCTHISNCEVETSDLKSAFINGNNNYQSLANAGFVFVLYLPFSSMKDFLGKTFPYFICMLLIFVRSACLIKLSFILCTHISHILSFLFISSATTVVQTFIISCLS